MTKITIMARKNSKAKQGKHSSGQGNKQKDDKLEFKGVVVEAQRSALFKVQIRENMTIQATIAGRLRKNHIRILLGDNVTVEVTPYDLTRGLITWRNR